MKNKPVASKAIPRLSRGRPIALIVTALLLALVVLLGSAGTLKAASVVATVPVGSYPYGVGVNPTTDKIYVANLSNNNVSVIDGATDTVTGSPIPVGNSPTGVGVNPTTNKIYVANCGDYPGTVSVIDGATGTVTGTITVGTQPKVLGVNPTTDKIYVANYYDNTVSVIDGSSDTVTGSPIPVGTSPNGVGVNPTTNKIYVANTISNNVSVIDGSTGAVTGSPIPVGTSPNGVGVNPTTDKIYVANYGVNTVSVIDGASDTVTGSPIPVGTSPTGVGVNPTTDRIYVANSNSNNVSVIDGASDTVTGSPIPVGTSPTGVGVNPTTDRIYVANNGDNTVSVLYDGPTTTSLNPDHKTAGDVSFTLTVNGTGFVSNSVIQWNGTNLTTTYVSDTQLTALVPATDIQTAGTAPVTVFTPGPGESNAQTFTINPVITVTQGAGGTISPAGDSGGNVYVDYGSDQSFTITPNTHYHLDSVTTDAGVVTPVDNHDGTYTYTFIGVTANHTITASFTIDTNAVTASVSGGGGGVSPSSQDIDWGGTADITIQPYSGYHIDTITVNGVAQTPPFSSPFELTGVTEPTDVVVAFASGINTWYFADSCTRPGFQEYLCLGNPGSSPAQANVTYLFTGGVSATDQVTIPAGSRVTLDVNANPKVGPGKDFSVEVSATSDIFCERPMYFDYSGGITGGSDVVAATAPAPTWYFAEGYTGPGFDEYICVLNPGDGDANLTFKFQTQEAGEKDYSGTPYVCPAHSRATFKVNDILGGAYQTSLELDSDQPIVAERPMYFTYAGAWTGGHSVMGATQLAADYYFAEGCTRAGFDEWLTLANPTDAAITVTATYQLGQGQGGPVDRSYDVPAYGRASVYVNDPTQGVGTDKDVSVHLSCPTAFLAERPMYFDYTYGGVDWTGGSCVIGATSPATDWFFAEGCTLPNFQEWLTLENPGGIDASVTITYYTQQGQIGSRDLTIPANSRISVFVNDPTEGAGPGHELSARIHLNFRIAGNGQSSDVGAARFLGIVVERPMYFNYGGWTGGDDALGYPSMPPT